VEKVASRAEVVLYLEGDIRAKKKRKSRVERLQKGGRKGLARGFRGGKRDPWTRSGG